MLDKEIIAQNKLIRKMVIWMGQRKIMVSIIELFFFFPSKNMMLVFVKLLWGLISYSLESNHRPHAPLERYTTIGAKPEGPRRTLLYVWKEKFQYLLWLRIKLVKLLVHINCNLTESSGNSSPTNSLPSNPYVATLNSSWLSKEKTSTCVTSWLIYRIVEYKVICTILKNIMKTWTLWKNTQRKENLFCCMCSVMMKLLLKFCCSIFHQRIWGLQWKSQENTCSYRNWHLTYLTREDFLNWKKMKRDNKFEIPFRGNYFH